MPLGDIFRTLVVRGSDGLVYALYQRVRADGGAASPVDRPTCSWRDLADRAEAEGVLTAREASLLRALVAGADAPVPAGPASLRTSSARQRQAS